MSRSIDERTSSRARETRGSRPFTCALVDLDGTLTDSAPGIIASLTATFAEIGVPMPRDPMAWVGPPMLDSFRDFAGFDDARSHEALVVYRRYARARGVGDIPAYSGVATMLQQLDAAGMPLSLATSKPESQARLILDHLGLTGYFRELTGASEDEVRSAKADVVAEALQRLVAGGVDVSRPVMVGDRHYDVEGAAAHGVPTVLVRWGYGRDGESGGAIATAETPTEVVRILLG